MAEAAHTVFDGAHLIVKKRDARETLNEKRGGKILLPLETGCEVVTEDWPQATRASPNRLYGVLLSVS